MGNIRTERQDKKIDHSYIYSRYCDLKEKYPYLTDKDISTRLQIPVSRLHYAKGMFMEKANV